MLYAFLLGNVVRCLRRGGEFRTADARRAGHRTKCWLHLEEECTGWLTALWLTYVLLYFQRRATTEYRCAIRINQVVLAYPFSRPLRSITLETAAATNPRPSGADL